ncbi:MAG: hypothetical protein DHS20C14_13550 [Phycisphaeraceae bacterium]|nr:MAG: hypothetical protein DHS20C14_13550 [Phycisphaeraceae bacterium]
MTRTRPIGILILAGACLMAPLAGLGCSVTPPGSRKGGIRARMVLHQREHTVPIEGEPIAVGRFLGVDVTNNAGGVFVTAHDRYEEAKVEFHVRHVLLLRKLAREENWPDDALRGPWFVAEHDHGSQTGVLRVRATDRTLPDGSRPLLDVHIYTPACDGVVIENTHGDVELVGVRGTVSVVSDGGIELRTDEPLTQDLSLRTSGSGVLVVAAPTSSGTFLITAPEGRATFTSKFGTAERVTSEQGRWIGVWNGGANTVTLQAAHGHARYMVKDRPELYTPSFH